jgi:DNA-binding NtrC family response regulator
LWGEGETMRRLRAFIATVAPTDATVLILGESGTGKELAARAIHVQSRRRYGPFVPVNTAALPRDLIQSTLFGHEKGAFTGADQARRGCCEAADRGTLFLDEIGEMDIALQAKLLRFLQERTFQRVGSSQTVSVDVRILSATNRDPAEQVRRGELREDLYFRLNVVPLVLPPLRERREDIPYLAARFLQRAAVRQGRDVTGFTAEAMLALVRYAWPGNVRQLENLIERLVIFSRAGEIDLADLPPEVRAAPREPAAVPPQPAGGDPGKKAGLQTIEEMEKKALVEALVQSHGSAKEAARLLGLGQATVYRKIKRYGINLDGLGRGPG